MPKPPKLPSGMIKRGNAYYAHFRQAGRPIRKKLSPNLEVAKVMLQDLRMKCYRENNGEIDNDILIGELSSLWLRSLSQRLAASTVTRYRQNMANIERLIPVKKVNLLSIELIEEFREIRLSEFVPNGNGKTVSACTVNKDVAALSNMLNWGTERKKIGSNPIDGVKKLREFKKEERALKPSETQLVFEKSNIFWRRIWYAYFTTGLRKMELANLLLSDIDWDAREIIVRATLTKNSTARRIPIDDVLFEILLTQKQNAPNRKPGQRGGSDTVERIKEKFSKRHVFVNTCNSPLGNNVYRAFKAVCKKCGIETETRDAAGNVIEVVTLHSTRHSFATVLISNGADPRTVQALMGHKTLDMTMRIYAKVNATRQQEAIEKLDFSSQLPSDESGGENISEDNKK